MLPQFGRKAFFFQHRLNEDSIKTSRISALLAVSTQVGKLVPVGRSEFPAFCGSA